MRSKRISGRAGTHLDAQVLALVDAAERAFAEADPCAADRSEGVGQQIARRVQAALEDEVKAAAPSPARAQAGPPSLASPLPAEPGADQPDDREEGATHLVQEALCVLDLA